MPAATRIRIYCDESDRAGRSPLTDAIIRLLRKERAAGVTVILGSIGFGGSRALHSGRNVELPPSRPCIVEWLDTPDNVDRIWPRLEPLVQHVVVTRESVEILVLPHHGLRRLPKDEVVADVMETLPITVAAQTPVQQVVETVVDHGLGFVPVVIGGALVGVITNGDLVGRDGTAGDVMTRDVVTIGPGATLREAAHMMVERGLKRLPVLGSNSQLLGVVSRADLLRTAADVYPDEAVEPGIAAAVTIGEAATRHVPAVSLDTPVAEVVDRVASSRLNRAVVVDGDGRPAGVVSDEELLRRIDLEDQSRLERLMRRGGGDPKDAGQTAAGIMEPSPFLVPADTPVARAVADMIAARAKLMVVVDEDGRLVGTVDRAGALRAMFSLGVGDDLR